MINKLNIVSGCKEGRSYLKDAFFTRPFRLADIGEDKSDKSLHLMVMSSSPGVLDNDHYDIDITVEEQSRLLLESQSYQRLFNMQEGAQQKTMIKLKSNSTFSYIQHPVVPHEHSIFKAKNLVYLEDNCSFTIGEIITCGRKHSGEIFRFTKFQSLTEIYHHNKLILKDNILLQPQLATMNTIGQMEGFTHQATLIHINTSENRMEELADTLHHHLMHEEHIAFGVSSPCSHCLIVRVLGNGGEQLYNSFRSIQSLLWQQEYSLSESI